MNKEGSKYFMNIGEIFFTYYVVIYLYFLKTEFDNCSSISLKKESLESNFINQLVQWTKF